MAGAWPRPQSDAAYAALALAAAAGPAGALLLVRPDAWAAVGALLVLAFAVSLASAVGRVSPRVAQAGLLMVGLAMACLAVSVAPGPRALFHTGTSLALVGVALLAAAQWFDARRTLGLAGLGMVAASIGAVGYVLGPVLGMTFATSTWGSGWPGGTEVWRWVFEPWRLGYSLALVWSLGTAAWLQAVHAKARRAFTPPNGTPPS